MSVTELGRLRYQIYARPDDEPDGSDGVLLAENELTEYPRVSDALRDGFTRIRALRRHVGSWCVIHILDEEGHVRHSMTVGTEEDRSRGSQPEGRRTRGGL